MSEKVEAVVCLLMVRAVDGLQSEDTTWEDRKALLIPTYLRLGQ